MNSSFTVTQSCGICMENKPSSDFIPTNGCSHKYCRTCAINYVSKKIKNNMFDTIACPNSGCKNGTFKSEVCKSVHAHEVFGRWLKEINERFFCPNKDCPDLLNTDSGKERVKCPRRDRHMCIKCVSAWHQGLACEDFQKLGKDERELEDLLLMELATKEGWKRCPSCRIYVEKVAGCLSLKCRCDHIFCYNCGTTMTQDHYCAACQH